MDDDRERVDRFAGDQNVELDHGRLPSAGQLIVKRSIAARDGLEPIVEIENDFVQRQFIREHDARGGYIFKVELAAALLFDELEDSADVFLVGKNLGGNDRLLNIFDVGGIWPARRIVDFDRAAIGHGDEITHARRSGDEVELIFALQALLNDFHVQEAEKAAAKAEAQRDRTLGLEEERRIVETKFFKRIAQQRVLM